ncbi:uncharacterized protein DS421_16g549380 [Arachis hypogaea]|nr:uncharacterized protein DS421_16g549380 [Arachis hypogaea]
MHSPRVRISHAYALVERCPDHAYASATHMLRFQLLKSSIPCVLSTFASFLSILYAIPAL